MIGPALAETNGIAIAAAPQEGYFMCMGANADDTLACARRKCERAGGAPCLRVRWCYPSGWSGSMRYTMDGGSAETMFVCGAPSDEGVKAMMTAWCETSPWASDCALVSMWDPLGNEVGVPQPLGGSAGDAGASGPAGEANTDANEE